MAGKTIGIDLGTTNSRVAVWHEGQVKVIPNKEGYPATPSYVTFNDSEKLVGSAARHQIFLNLKKTVFDSKRLIGRTYQNVCRESDQLRRFWPFQVVEKDGKAAIKVGRDTLNAESVAAMILEQLKGTAEKFLGAKVTGAVVTVPGTFNDAQRLATIDAARVAGFETVHLINEPTAAALAYSIDSRNKEKRNALVYSLGGGSFDASVVKMDGLDIQELSTAGDPCMGGTDLDIDLVEFVVRENHEPLNIDTSDIKSLMMINRACEKAKRTLSAIDEAYVAVDSFNEENDLCMKITRHQLENVCQDFIRQTVEKVEEALKKAKMSKQDVDHIILVGGSTLIPKIRQVVQDLFPGKPLCKIVDPTEAAVRGAAIQAAIISGENIDIEEEQEERAIRPEQIDMLYSYHMRYSESQDENSQASNETESQPGDIPPIGIRLGVMSSQVAVWMNGHANIILNRHGETSTPNYVAFTEHERLIGAPAKAQVEVTAENTVYDMARLIGRPYDDPDVLSNLKSWSFHVVNDGGKPSIEVQHQGEKKRLYPEQISAMVLANLKETAETQLRTKVIDAVLTVPAYFNDAQRQATKDAGQIAGLNVLRIINEPTAAVIAYGLENKTEEINVLVYHLGRSTFEVTVIGVKDSSFKIKSTCSDTHLGGIDFENRIVDFYVDMLKSKHNKDITDNRKAMQRLRGACEEAQETLYQSREAYVTVRNLGDGIDLNHVMSRTKFDSLCLDPFQKTLDLVQQVLSDANLDVSKIDEVVLAGCCSRIPKIQSMVKKFFNDKELLKNIRPEEAVVIGAAKHAAILYSMQAHYETEDENQHKTQSDANASLTYRMQDSGPQDEEVTKEASEPLEDLLQYRISSFIDDD